MEIRDFNGAGAWSCEAVLERYRAYAREFGISHPITLAPKEHVAGEVKWISPVMDEVILGIERGDRACIAIGIEFVEQDQRFPFGKILKSNTARALRRAQLSQAQVDRLRTRIVSMLLAGSIAHEYKEYARLLRRIGIGDWWPVIERRLHRDKPRVMRYYNYFREAFKRTI